MPRPSRQPTVAKNRRHCQDTRLALALNKGVWERRAYRCDGGHCGGGDSQRKERYLAAQGRRKALVKGMKSEARLAATTEEPPTHDRTPVWPSPSVRVFGSDGRPFVTMWKEAAYGA